MAAVSLLEIAFFGLCFQMSHFIYLFSRCSQVPPSCQGCVTPARRIMCRDVLSAITTPGSWPRPRVLWRRLRPSGGRDVRDGSPSRRSFSRVDSRGSPSSFLSKCRESPEKGFSRVFSCSECVFLSRIAFVSFGGRPGAGEKERERENQERRKPPGLVSRVKLENSRAARSGESLGAKSR